MAIQRTEQPLQPFYATPSFRGKVFWALALLVSAVAFFVLFYGESAPSEYRLTRQEPRALAPGCYPVGVRIDPDPVVEGMIEIDTAAIAARNWSYPLNPYPALPTNPFNCINATVVERLVKEAAGALETTVLLKALNQTLSVTHEQFEALLSHATQKFNRFLGRLPENQRDYVVTFPEPNKSNRWVSELALKYLSRLPTDVVLLDDLEKSLRMFPHVRQIVLFDDSTYSCLQISGLVGGIQYGRRVHTVIPFMNDPDCVLKGLQQDKKVGLLDTIPRVMSHYALSFGKELSTDALIQIDREREAAKSVNLLSSPWNQQGRHTITFAHRVADYLSVPIGVKFATLKGRHYIFLQNPTPPYRQVG